MSDSAIEQVQESLDAIYRAESGRILATLIRLLGDFDLAEDAVHDAFAAALERWPQEGVPANPRAWLVSTGRFKAIDTLRPGVKAGPFEIRPAADLTEMIRESERRRAEPK
jgi:RNA polymerase sigma-70 factor, ECF subfamily